jgi:hypothetical protein
MLMAVNHIPQVLSAGFCSDNDCSSSNNCNTKICFGIELFRFVAHYIDFDVSDGDPHSFLEAIQSRKAAKPST